MQISVVIPTYNYGRFVCEAVESALTQTLAPLEVVVVDDGSTDDTAGRLRTFGDRIRYLRQENQGLSAARNAGIEASRGEWIALLDSDDAFHPRKLELQAGFLDRCDLLGTGSTTEFSWKACTPTYRQVSLESAVMRVPFCPSSVVFRKTLYGQIGGFDPAVNAAADRDYWIRAASVGSVGVLDAPLTFYRVHSQSMTIAGTDRMIAHERAVIDKAFGMPALKHRIAFRRRVLGLAATSAAWMLLNDAGRPRDAAKAMLKSLFYWPLPFRRREAAAPLYRARLFARILRALAR